MELTTERLILRPFDDEDAESVFLYARDPRVGPRAGWQPHESVEESLDIIRTILSEKHTYAVCLKTDGDAVGAVGLTLGEAAGTDGKPEEGELGCWLGVPFWGNGYIPEALGALIRYAFETLHLKRLWYGYFEGNGQSRRVQEKCGFRYHHTEDKRWVPAFEEYRTEHLSVLTYEDWRETHPYRLYLSHSVFPTPDIERTAEFYREKLGFLRVDYLDAAEPHVCLYRDGIEFILTQSRGGQAVIPNHILYGYGGDAYIITDSQEALQREFEEKGVTIVKRLQKTDYHNREFAVEDIDGRWLYFGIKE